MRNIVEYNRLNLLPLVLLPLAIGFADAAGHNGIPEACHQYDQVYATIDRDLGLFQRAGGITPALTLDTIKKHTAGNREKGLAVGIYDKKVYVISNTKFVHLKRFGHHVSLWAAYLLVLLDLESKYGEWLPNVEFVFHTIDRPVLLRNDTGVNYPVFRFCKSAAHPDVLVPNFHFYMQRYQSRYLDRMEHVNAAHPWEGRLPKAFARFTAYPRYVHPNDTHTQRLGAGGTPLCVYKGRTTAICLLRHHLHDWARNHTDRVDVSKDRHVPMEEHARFRYLMHVDGQGLSSKLELLLTLGSLVLKEESGYQAYYHHLLKPYEHYVPVWKPGGGPEDVLEAVEWAKAHDEEAHRIALAGQALARRFLSAEARACYWLALLRRYSETMTYDPVRHWGVVNGTLSGSGAAGLRYIRHARRFLDKDVGAFNPRLLRDMQWEP